MRKEKERPQKDLNKAESSERRVRGLDRRSGDDRRLSYKLGFFLGGGSERRSGDERRTRAERRTGWQKITDWTSVPSGSGLNIT